MRKPAIAIAISLLVVLVVLAAVWIGRKESSAAKLKKYKAELLAKGEPLSYANLAIPISTSPQHVATRRLFQTNSTPDFHTSPLVMEYIGPGKARVAWRGALHLVSTIQDEPFTVADWKVLEDQNGKIAATLEPFRQALEDPPPDAGWVYEDTYESSIVIPGGKLMLGTVPVEQGFVSFTIQGLHDGQIEAAMSGINSLAGMSTIYRNDIELNIVIRRAAFAQNAFGVTWEALQATNWDEARLFRLQRIWEKFDLMADAERVFQALRIGEVIMMEHLGGMKTREFVQALSFLNASSPTNFSGKVTDMLKTKVPLAAYKLNGLEEDELRQLRAWSEFIDNFRGFKTGRTFSEVLGPMESEREQFEEYLGKGASIRRDIYDQFLVFPFHPIMAKAVQNIVRTEVQRQLTVTAIAIKRYQLKHGEPPPSLAALVPEYLKKMPIDLMSGKELLYRVKGDGTFVLYSTGEDGKDDGGDPRPARADGKFGLWEGRDAVWPTAASPEEQAAADRAR